MFDIKLGDVIVYCNFEGRLQEGEVIQLGANKTAIQVLTSYEPYWVPIAAVHDKVVIDEPIIEFEADFSLSNISTLYPQGDE